jgi:hypothetical protein
MHPALLAVPAALLLVLPAAAGAARAERPSFPEFAAADADGNGALTAEELEAYGEARFAEADADRDGALAMEELVTFARVRLEAAGRRAPDRAAPRMAEKLMTRADTNGDGVITAAERLAIGPGRLMHRLDRDGDGVISQAEAAAPRMRAERRPRDRRPATVAEAPPPVAAAPASPIEDAGADQ